MSYAEITQHPGHALMNVVHRLAAQYRHNRARRVAYNRVYGELAALSSRELSDIGISRGDVPGIAQKAADEVA